MITSGIISIIVPVYRAEAYLARCVDSILSQTHTDFELILVDDGSPDNCGAVCDDYARKDRRVRVLHQENRGVSAARNNGVRNAIGDYVTFIDSDDWVAPQYLEILYENAVRHQADISVCEAEQTAEDHVPLREYSGDSVVLSGAEAIRKYGLHSRCKFRYPFGKLVRRTLVRLHSFPEDRAVAEDMAVIYKWYDTCTRVADTDAAPYFYYQNPQGVSNAKFSHKNRQFLLAMEEVLIFLEQRHFDEVYGVLLHEYLFKAAWQYEQFRDVLHDPDTAEQIQENMRAHIRKNRRKYEITPKQDAYALNVCWPRAMKAYWRWQLLREEGGRKTLRRIFDKIRKRNGL